MIKNIWRIVPGRLFLQQWNKITIRMSLFRTKKVSMGSVTNWGLKTGLNSSPFSCVLTLGQNSQNMKKMGNLVDVVYYKIAPVFGYLFDLF